ncbi:MAG: hypothetical protein CMH54_06935 [Myxococcales bacterium]|nr:hypothetical protein [Myxococcales bacterium]
MYGARGNIRRGIILGERFPSIMCLRSRYCSLLVCCSLLIPAGAAAQTSEIKPEEETEPYQYALPVQSGVDYSTNQLTVTADRSEQRQFEAPRSVEIVSQRQIRESQTPSVPESLVGTTGIFAQNTNRGAGAPFLRGLIGPSNLIVVDGIRFNTATFRTGPNQYLALIDPAAVKRIEVVRGPSSVLYGNGAMGGVIHVLTQDVSGVVPGHGKRGSVETLAATADLSTGLRVATHGETSGVSFLVGGSAHRFGILQAGGGVDQPWSDYEAYGWRGKANVALSQNLNLRLAHFGRALMNAGRADQLGKGDLRRYDTTDLLSYAHLRWTAKGILRSVDTAISHHRLYDGFERYKCQRTLTGQVLNKEGCLDLDPTGLTKKKRFLDVVDVLGAYTTQNFRLGRRLRLVSGAEAYWEMIGSEQDTAGPPDFVYSPASRGNFSDDSTFLTAGAFLNGTVGLVDLGSSIGLLQLNGGVRYSYFAAHAPGVPEIGDVDYRHGGLVASGGVQLLNPGSHTLYANFVQGFRAPNLQESTVLGDTGSKFEVPNADLRPEKGDTVELGARVRESNLEVGVSGFWTRLDDLIDESPALFGGLSEVDGKPVVQRTNARSGEMYGVEGSVEYSSGPLGLFGNATWIQGDVSNGDGFTQPARRIPPVFGTAGIRFASERRNAWISGRVRWALRQDRLHSSDKKDARICQTEPSSGLLQEDCQGTPGYMLLDVHGGVALSPSMDLFLGVENLLDQTARDHGSGYDMAGLNLKITVQARF